MFKQGAIYKTNREDVFLCILIPGTADYLLVQALSKNLTIVGNQIIECTDIHGDVWYALPYINIHKKTEISSMPVGQLQEKVAVALAASPEVYPAAQAACLAEVQRRQQQQGQ